MTRGERTCRVCNASLRRLLSGWLKPGARQRIRCARSCKAVRKPGLLRVTDETNQGSMPFGHVLRAKRLAKKLGLRKFAELVGVSPTYVSQVEQCNVMPPTADRIKRMAELL